MHDRFLVETPVLCPLDGAPIAEWQDDDGGTMLTWRQGRATPLEADESDLDGWFGDVSGQRLPPFFGLRAHHADHWLRALGETDADDVWRGFRLIDIGAAVLIPGEFWPPIRPGHPPSPRFADLRLWREGAGIYELAAGRLATERERQRAELPAHGGSAMCRTCQFADKDVPAAAVVLGYPGFVCDLHLSERAERLDDIILR